MNRVYQWTIVVFFVVVTGVAKAEGQRLPGKFVWAELITYDIAAAENFYSRIFGWQFSDEKNYRIAWKRDEPVGGLVFRPRPDDRSAKSRWIAYISVIDIESVKKSIMAANGSAVAEPRNIDGLGELAVFADNEGALFGLINSGNSDPEDYLAEQGEWIWIQLFSRNAKESAQFYQHIGNYQRFDNPQQAGSYLLSRDGYARAAVSTISSAHADAKSVWVPFLRVENISEILDKVRTAGGKVLVEPREDLYDNRVAMIEAPDGSAVGIMVWSSQTTSGDISP
jgi:predicted enzyme related to lactoylglutathione lyase